ncbi:ENV2 protein, partial [Crocuta crocuta]
LTAAYEALNQSNPDVTESCWLCYDIQPPYYEAVGLTAPYNTSNEIFPAGCKWDQKKPGLTLQAVSGKGTCLGTLPPNGCPVCSLNNYSKAQSKWIIPPSGGWWICSQTGLTPCLNTQVFNSSAEYRVMVLVFPKINYHSEGDLYDLWTGGTPTQQIIRTKREALTITLAALFG